MSPFDTNEPSSEASTTRNPPSSEPTSREAIESGIELYREIQQWDLVDEPCPPTSRSPFSYAQHVASVERTIHVDMV